MPGRIVGFQGGNRLRGVSLRGIKNRLKYDAAAIRHGRGRTEKTARQDRHR